MADCDAVLETFDDNPDSLCELSHEKRAAKAMAYARCKKPGVGGGKKAGKALGAELKKGWAIIKKAC